ncbi:hypothetical protein NKJ59_04625 [Mesorhizobium australicum]|uniref:hypothetical protein n=1 Tax=Mesorhizobium australicum TaxID=536018 RepID=UPI00333CB3BC
MGTLARSAAYGRDCRLGSGRPFSVDLMLTTGTIDERSSRDRKKLADAMLHIITNALVTDSKS